MVVLFVDVCYNQAVSVLFWFSFPRRELNKVGCSMMEVEEAPDAM